MTALVVQDYLGGELRRALVSGESHYWNEVGGDTIDLTRTQFRVYEPSRPSPRTREYVLSFPDTRRRYEVLRGRVEQAVDSAER